MPHRRSAPPGRLFFGVFTGLEDLFDWVRAELTASFGPLDPTLESPVFPFPETRTYRKTMGSDLKRKFFFLSEPFAQDGLAAIKLSAIDIEEKARTLEPRNVARPINIDPGLLNDCRIVLASTKDYSHRIYRGDGIWEEVTLVFTKGEFQTLPWTYPDFQQGEYREYFAAARKRHLEFLNDQRN